VLVEHLEKIAFARQQLAEQHGGVSWGLWQPARPKTDRQTTSPNGQQTVTSGL